MSAIKLKKKTTIKSIEKKYADSDKITMVTCYDAAFAKLIDKTAIDIVLVGDSLGNVVLGYDTTVPVTLEHMVHHASAVARGLKRPLLLVDMPFMTYHKGIGDTLSNAQKLFQEGGAEAVKLEGGLEVCEAVHHISQAGMPVMGHIGLTPQSINHLGGFFIQGKSIDQRKKLLDSAKSLEQAGAFAIVLELIPQDLALEITESVQIPTIGIGAGPYCAGQVLVLNDILGLDSGFKPRFVKQYAKLHDIVVGALNSYHSDVVGGGYPSADHSISLDLKARSE